MVWLFYITSLRDYTETNNKDKHITVLYALIVKDVVYGNAMYYVSGCHFIDGIGWTLNLYYIYMNN